mgnify:CR=1 FL=1
MRASDVPELNPHETGEQQAVFQWAKYHLGKYPDLEWMYAIPNGGYRHKATAARLKAEGVKSGVPDICLPIPRGIYPGLYIEMKRPKKGRLSENQKRWRAVLCRNGYRVERCDGWQQAVAVLLNYLNLEGMRE